MNAAETLFWQLAAEWSWAAVRAGRVFKEWLSVPRPDRRTWRALLREGIAFVE